MATRKKLSVKSAKSAKKSQITVPYHYKPAGLSLEEWQIELRRQFVETRYFEIEKIDDFKSPF